MPQYERQVKEAPVPGVMSQPNAPLSAFGGGEETARAFRAAGDLAETNAAILAEKAKRAKDEIDMGAVSGAVAELSALGTKLLHDPDSGALNQLGENSFETYQPTMEAFWMGATQIVGTLTTPEQKAAFRQHADNQRSQADQSLQIHISGQRTEYVAKNFAAAAEQYANAAEANALTNPQARQANILLQQKELIKLSRLKGLSDVAGAAFIADEQSKTQARIIQMMLARDQDQTAKAYYESLPQGTIRNQEAPEVERALELGSLRGNAQRETIKIFAPKYEMLESGQGVAMVEPTEQQTMDAVDKITDHKLQDEVRSRVRQRWEDVRRAEVFDQNRALDEASKFILNAPKSGAIYDPRKGLLDDVPTQVMAKLKEPTVKKLRELARGIRAGEHVQTDPDLFHELMIQARDPQTRNKFIGRNLLEDYKGLSIADRKHFEEMQTKLANEDPRTSTMLNFHQKVEDTLLANKYINKAASKLEGDDRRRYAQFSLTADRRIRDFEKLYLDGKPASPDEMQREIDKMVKEKNNWNTAGIIYTSKAMPAAMLLREEVRTPKWKEEELRGKLREAGKTITPDKIQRLHHAQLIGDRELYDEIMSENE